MIKDNQLCYETGNPINFGDYINVKIDEDKFLIVQLTEVPIGIQTTIVNGQPKEEIQKASGFFCRKIGQMIPPEQLAEMKLYEVITLGVNDIVVVDN